MILHLRVAILVSHEEVVWTAIEPHQKSRFEALCWCSRFRSWSFWEDPWLQLDKTWQNDDTIFFSATFGVNAGGIMISASTHLSQKAVWKMDQWTPPSVPVLLCLSDFQGSFPPQPRRLGWKRLDPMAIRKSHFWARWQLHWKRASMSCKRHVLWCLPSTNSPTPPCPQCKSGLEQRRWDRRNGLQLLFNHGNSMLKPLSRLV